MLIVVFLLQTQCLSTNGQYSGEDSHLQPLRPSIPFLRGESVGLHRGRDLYSSERKGYSIRENERQRIREREQTIRDTHEHTGNSFESIIGDRGNPISLLRGLRETLSRFFDSSAEFKSYTERSPRSENTGGYTQKESEYVRNITSFYQRRYKETASREFLSDIKPRIKFITNSIINISGAIGSEIIGTIERIKSAIVTSKAKLEIYRGTPARHKIYY